MAWQSVRFLGFLLHSGNRYRVHSPFLYSFIDEVLRKDRMVNGTTEIEAIRNECLSSSEVILKTDFGRGAGPDEQAVYPASMNKLASRSLTSGRHARRLSRAARFMNSEHILELGTSLGITTAYLALSNPDAKVTSLEGCPELSKIARAHLMKLEITNAEIIEGRFEDTLGTEIQKTGKLDFVYIDGNHRKEPMLAYFNQCLPYMSPNSIMILDDINLNPETVKAWDLIRQHPSVRISLDLFYSGWLIFRKESTKEHFRLRYI